MKEEMSQLAVRRRMEWEQRAHLGDIERERERGRRAYFGPTLMNGKIKAGSGATIM